jgi:hypothetical protein
MKKLRHAAQYLFLFTLVLFAQLTTFAQDSAGSSSTTTTTIRRETTTTTEWYTQPWVWVVGGAVFLLILIALIRGNSSKTRETNTTVIRKDNNY